MVKVRAMQEVNSSTEVSPPDSKFVPDAQASVQDGWMRKVMFLVLMIVFVVMFILTCLALFADFGHLGSGNKTLLTTTFVIESGVAVFALFYKLFGIKKDNPVFRSSGTDGSAAKVESKQNVDVVTDSPVGVDISLNAPVAAGIFGPFDATIQTLIASEGFADRFRPATIAFISTRDYASAFGPNVNIQINQNPWGTVNLNLAEFVEKNNSVAQAAFADSRFFRITSDRHIRTGNNMAVQWYSAQVGGKVDITQYQKFVISEELIGIMTISYNDDTVPEDIQLLQSLLKDFGVQKN
jgi:hypothetical protein